MLASLGAFLGLSWALSDFSKTAIVSLSGFSVAVTVYFVLWALFGYGGGMITSRKLSPVY